MALNWSTWTVACGAAVCAAVFGGCHSDVYYQNRAVERAREYLLKEAGELNAEERYFVIFNDPVFLTSPIIGSTEFIKDSAIDAPVLNDQLIQICISWKLPSRDEWYLVYGASNGRMDFWYPDRLVRKKFALSKISDLEKATTLSRTYARDNLFDLMSAAEQNTIRFHFPSLLETNFEPNFNPTGDKTQQEIDEAKEKAAQSIQYTLVWELPDKKDVAVFCGFGDAEMAGWNINFAGRVSLEELTRHTVRVIKTPEEFYRNFPERYAKPAVKKTSAKPTSEKGGK
jgi:hypothetical protein